MGTSKYMKVRDYFGIEMPVKEDGDADIDSFIANGGIGKFVQKSDFEHKLSDIVSYLEINTGIYVVDAIYCDSDDKKNEMRKPNTGMLSKMLDSHSLNSFYNKDDMLMIGDASGLPGQFSDSDKKCAENFGIDYLDVSDFVKTYNS